MTDFTKFRITQVSKRTRWQSRDALCLTPSTCASHIYERFGRNSAQSFGQLYVMRATQCFRTWQNNIFCAWHFYSDFDTMRHMRCRNETRSVKATPARSVYVSLRTVHICCPIWAKLDTNLHIMLCSACRVSRVVHIGAGNGAAIFLWQDINYSGQSVRRNIRAGRSLCALWPLLLEGNLSFAPTAKSANVTFSAITKQQRSKRSRSAIESAARLHGRSKIHFV